MKELIKRVDRVLNGVLCRMVPHHWQIQGLASSVYRGLVMDVLLPNDVTNSHIVIQA